MDWTAMLWVAAIPIFGYLLFMVLLRKDTERQSWEEAAAYVVYGLLAVWLLAIALTTFFRR
ncbi:MAG: hypothetical protein JWQ21_972 [Herminiimonas sp.]|jgi:multisubunit Na+/H+ antiporter MnhB subunit|nr:hypothetical protein [Herminiimonas sp.]